MTSPLLLRRRVIGATPVDFSYYEEIVLDSPTQVLPLDDASGSVAKAYVGDDGEYRNGPTLRALAGPSGRIPHGLALSSGPDDVVGDTIGGTAAHTYEIWVYTSSDIDAAHPGVAVIGTSNSYTFALSLGAVTTRLTDEVLSVGDTSTSDRRGWKGFSIPAGWHHYATTYAGSGNWNAYIDGAVITGAPWNGVPISAGGTVTGASGTAVLGRIADVGHYAVEGIAAFAHYNSVLSAARMAAHFAAADV